MSQRRRTSDASVARSAGPDVPSKQKRPRSSDDFPVVGIGASAGGLKAFQTFFDALPADSGMAFILIQHLDPTHESLMVELIAGHTSMPVQHANDGMPIEPNCVYVIPPGVYLSVRDGALYLSEPEERHGARLPFDFLLRSLAAEVGDRAVAVVLSGTGADGSVGMKAVKEASGLVIAQDPKEADFDGMPQSAIMTGVVDRVLRVAEIPAVLAEYSRRKALVLEQNASDPKDAAPDWLPEIIELLRTRTSHDFTLYKPGTLRRRIERRMAVAAIDSEDMDRYIEILRSDSEQLDLLAKDLLINVTGFFRDPKVFDYLAEKIAPDLVASHSTGNPLRIWVVGCSTGEEVYSLTMIFLEQIALAKRTVKLQVFASDVDADAVDSAREGLYPEAIATDVSPRRLERFFIKEDRGYRVSPELRAAVVFTVQDVLADPPFSRLDLISCRNLLIYLQPEAQAKVISLFHFALREDGMLLLGNAETVGNAEDRFDVISKPHRLYRHIGRSRPGELAYTMNAGEGVRLPKRQGQAPSRNAVLADLCQRLVMDTLAPAAVLINRKYECLYSLGPTDLYLRIVPGQPTHDLLDMARDGVRTKLRAAIQQASQQQARVVIGGGRIGGKGDERAFRIDAQPVTNQGEDLLLICFIEEPQSPRKRGRAVTSEAVDLERELDATRKELESAILNLEHSTDMQKTIAEETLSVNEEFQATNEELLTSKEELQSLNEELTALNSQLQETLERERTTSNDLQNVLNSTDVATLFLDIDLNIRFFTPAIKSFFHVIASDIGRPLADLSSMAADGELQADAATVLDNRTPIEREVKVQNGNWYTRRTLPYRAQDSGIEGIVITYTNITDRKRTADALEAAKHQAEQANVAKSRFLAAASHDLRQPLQTLVLLQGLLAKTVDDKSAQQRISRMGETLVAMSGMLNALLDINQIESGIVQAEAVDFPIDDLLNQIRKEFGYFAEAKGLGLRVVPCGLSIHSDPQLLAQMLRNLVSNALKYTRRGKVLLGCRRRGEFLSIEVWDTGIGMPEEELQKIFEEYYQVGNPAREQSHGLGLGLAIVQRLAHLLGHQVRTRSRANKGSVFAIEVKIARAEAATQQEQDRHDAEGDAVAALRRTGRILVVEDDPEIRDLLVLVFRNEGHRVTAAADANAALKILGGGTTPPDVLVTDHNLPGGMNGLQLAAKVRERLHRDVPVVVLTGDITTETLRDIAAQDYIHFNKPVNVDDLADTVQRLLLLTHAAPGAAAVDHGDGVGSPSPVPTSALNSALNSAPNSAPNSAIVYVVDDDTHVLDEFRTTIEQGGWTVETYLSAEDFLEAYRPGQEACLLIDAYLPAMSGLELLEQLKDEDHRLTAIMITGDSDVEMAVTAMKAGASDFIEKPVSRGDLLASIAHALELSSDAAKLLAWRENAAKRFASLTPRQRQVLTMILAGHPNKNIAADLHVSQRTVENHRAAIMEKTGVKSFAELVRLAVAADIHEGGGDDAADRPADHPADHDDGAML